MTDTAVQILAGAIVFATLVISAALRPSFLRGYWVILRVIIWAALALGYSVVILQAIGLILGWVKIPDYLTEQGMFGVAQIAFGVAMALGVVSLIARIIVGADNVPWFVDQETDSNAVWSGFLITLWFGVAMPTYNATFRDLPNGYQYHTSDWVFGSIFAYGLPALAVLGLIVLKIVNARQEADYLRWKNSSEAQQQSG